MGKTVPATKRREDREEGVRGSREEIIRTGRERKTGEEQKSKEKEIKEK